MAQQGTLFPELKTGSTALSPYAVENAPLRLWTFKTGEQDIARALRTAGMDWEVETRPMYYKDEGGNEHLADEMAIVRQDGEWGPRQLGSATDRYRPVQNMEAARLFEPLLDTGKFKVDAAGVTTSNRVWVSIRSNEEHDITGRGDQVVSRLLGHWKHDGGAAVTFQYLPMRIICSNMIQRLVNSDDRRSGITVRHYGDVPGAMGRVRELFDYLAKYEAEDVQAMMRLAKKPIRDVDAYFQSLIERPVESEYDTNTGYLRAVNRRDGVIADMHKRYDNPIGGPNVYDHNTYWAAYNAVTETVDHSLGVKGKRDYMDYAVFGVGSRMRGLAFENALAA
jgi:phage/plasmid-like protein (TIGR03299 family)